MQSITRMLKAGQRHERRWGLGEEHGEMTRIRLIPETIGRWLCPRCKLNLCKQFVVGAIIRDVHYLVAAPEPVDCRCGSETQEAPISFASREEAVAEVAGIAEEARRLGNFDWIPLIKVL